MSDSYELRCNVAIEYVRAMTSYMTTTVTAVITMVMDDENNDENELIMSE